MSFMKQWIKKNSTVFSQMYLSSKEVEYNYDDLLDEYFMQTDDEANTNTTYNAKNEGKYKTGLLTSESRDRLWGIIKIWFLVYLIIAIPLWCTRGWCCCCLVCKFCKPLKTINKAKKYLISYPPGILVIDGKAIHYDPTEREKECYEEFEHFIRTL